MLTYVVPKQLSEEHAPLWTGDQMPPERYVTVLTAEQVAEVRTAVAQLADALDGVDMTSDRTITWPDFPLPTVRPLLVSARNQIAAGCGLAVIRGLPVGDLDPRRQRVLARGLAAHLAPVASLNPAGKVLDRLSPQLPGGCGVQVPFHTDGADACALLCLHPGTSGGIGRFASAAAVHNAMRACAPELLGLLYEPFAFALTEGHRTGGVAAFESPIFSLHRGQFSARFARQQLLAAPQLTGTPIPGEAVSAFDLIEELAGNLSIDFTMRAGDLQVVNSHTVLHARTAFADPDEPGTGRSLLRCWLTFDTYTGRRPGPIDEALRRGWLSDAFVRGLVRYGHAD